MAKQSFCRSWPGDNRLSRFFLGFAIAGLAVLPVAADGDRHDGRGRGHDKHHRHDDYDRGGERYGEWRARDRNYYIAPLYPPPYFYSQPVYVPPPVYYAPRQSPGISLFFPLDLR